MSMTANRVTADNLEIDSRAMQALMQSGPQQKQALQSLRANALREVKEQHGKQTANWQQRQMNRLDKAFMQGFYQPQQVNSPRANAQRLDFDEWEQEDGDTMQEVRYNLTIVDDIINAGYTVNSSLARTVYTRQRESAWQVEGERSMDGRAQSNDDEAVLEIFGTPIPISHVDYEISTREQQQSQNMGEDLETRKARQAGRILRETEEKQMLEGWGPTIEDPQGNTLQMYGFKDSEVAITGSASGDWGTPSNVLDTIDAILNDLESQTSDNNRGPDPVEQGLWLYHHPNQRSDLRGPDPRGDGNMSVKKRIEQDYPYIDLRSAGQLNDGELVAVVQDPMFTEVINAQSPTNLSEDLDFGLATQYKALSARVPLLKKTYDGVKGSAFYTGA